MADYPSHKDKVTCCICDKIMLSWNYSQHLTDFHPEEDTTNRRGKAQASLVDFFKGLRKKAKIDHFQPPTEEVESVNLNNLEFNTSEDFLWTLPLVTS